MKKIDWKKILLWLFLGFLVVSGKGTIIMAWIPEFTAWLMGYAQQALQAVVQALPVQ